MSLVIRILAALTVLAGIICAVFGNIHLGLSGFFFGALTAVLAEPIRRWLFRAELHLSFGQTSDYIAPTGMFNNGKKVGEAVYLRAKVINKTGTTAKRCRAYLVNIEERSARTGNFEQTIHSDTLALFWACKRSRDENLAPLDIPQGVNQYFDILYAASIGPAQFVPCIEFVPARFEEFMSKPGTYRFTVMVTGDEVAPVYLKIIFTWTGVWDKFTATLE